MTNVQGNGDISVFTADAASLLGICKEAKIGIALSKGDTSTIARSGERTQTVGAEVNIDTGLRDALSADATLMESVLAISAFTIGGVDYKEYLAGGSFTGTNKGRKVGGVTNKFRWLQNFGKSYQIQVVLHIPATAESQTPNFARNVYPGLVDTDLADQDLTRATLSMTIDGGAITLPCEIDSVDHQIIGGEGSQEQVITINMTGNDPGTGDYPTAPTGTGSMLAKAFTAINTAYAFVATTAAIGGGVTIGGNFIIETFSFSFNPEEILTYQYGFRNQGTITIATN